MARNGAEGTIVARESTDAYFVFTRANARHSHVSAPEDSRRGRLTTIIPVFAADTLAP